MCVRIFIQAIILFGSCFSLTQLNAQESITLKPVVETAKSGHATALKYLEGQLNAEKRVLKRLQKLRDHEHASWFELSQQQRKVNELAIYAVCLDEFQKKVLEVEQVKTVSQTFEDDSVVDCVPLKLYSPDSVRLLGWILVPAESVDRIQAGLDRKMLGKTDDSGIFLDALDLMDSPEWTQSTIEVLQHELQMNGSLIQSQLKLAYLEKSSPQIKALCEAQLLPESRVKSLESKIKQASKQITHETQRRQRLRDAMDDLTNRFADEKPVSSPKMSNSENWPKNWPKEVLSENAFLDHLLALYQQQLLLKAQEDVAILNLDFWQRVVQRLPKNDPVTLLGSDSSSTHGRLTGGVDWERKKYEHKVDLLKAQIESLRHQQIVFDLEERRFLRARDLLVAASGYRSVSTFSEAMTPSLPLRLMGFVEMDWSAETWSQLQVSAGQTDFWEVFRRELFGAAGNDRQYHISGSRNLRLAQSQVGPSAERSITLNTPRAFPAYSNGGTHPSKIQPGISHLLVRDHETPKNPGRFYEYGELKAKYRREARVGQMPWYLPGSPGNFGGQR